MNKGQFGKLQFFLFVIPLLAFLVFFYYGYSSGTNYQVPDNLKTVPIGGISSVILDLIGIPKDWQFFPALLYLLFIPYVAVVIIIYGFLRELQIFTFNGAINWVLAFLIGFSLIPFGVFTKMVIAILATMGVYGTLAFGLLFVLGVGYLFLQKTYGWGYIEAGKYTGLKSQGRYAILRNWLQEVAGRNLNHPLVADIADELEKADKKWDKQEYPEAIRELEGFARNVARRRGRRFNLPKRPPGI